MKLLMIGNSFAQDTLAYAPAVAESMGLELEAYNLYIGGCSLARHLFEALEEKRDYTLEHYRADLNHEYTAGAGIDDGLSLLPWDAVSFQQASNFSGFVESYLPLDALRTYVAARVPATVRYLWHMTWAYQGDYASEAFARYGNDQGVMYEKIRRAVDTYIRPRGLDVIPNGVAIQGGRAVFGDVLTRDGYHLSYDKGRYIAALTLVSRLFGVRPEDATFVPDGITDEEAALCRAVAHAATYRP